MLITVVFRDEDKFYVDSTENQIHINFDDLGMGLSKKAAQDLAEEIFDELGLDKPEELRERIEELEEELQEWEASYNIRKRGII